MINLIAIEKAFDKIQYFHNTTAHQTRKKELSQPDRGIYRISISIIILNGKDWKLSFYIQEQDKGNYSHYSTLRRGFNLDS